MQPNACSDRALTGPAAEELTALPQAPSWIKWKENDGRENDGREGKGGNEEKEMIRKGERRKQERELI